MTESRLNPLHRLGHFKRLPSSSPSPSRPHSPTPSEHVFHLTQSGPSSSNSPPWLSLRVRSHAGAGKTHPLYFDRDVVEGTVHLNLDSPQHIIGVSVVVRAQHLAVGVDHPPFLELTQHLWPSTVGEPKDGSPTRKPSSGKLSGHYTWPFAMKLPSEVVVQKDGSPMAFPLPPSCSPKGLSAYIDYKLQVIVRRSTLRVDNTYVPPCRPSPPSSHPNHSLTTSFVYLPRSRAPRPSRLLQAAYEHGRPILGPHLDPEGWRITPTQRLSGTFQNSPPTYLDCTVSGLLSPSSTGSDSSVASHRPPGTSRDGLSHHMITDPTPSYHMQETPPFRCISSLNRLTRICSTFSQVRLQSPCNLSKRSTWTITSKTPHNRTPLIKISRHPNPTTKKSLPWVAAGPQPSLNNHNSQDNWKGRLSFAKT